MNLNKAALALIALFELGHAHADECRDQLPQILQTVYGGDAVAAQTVVCKVWPAQPQFTLVAVPLPKVRHEGYGETDLEILVVKTDTRQIQARRLEPHLLDWDAVYVDGMVFDTALYRLSEQQLAFGLRIDRRGSSRANPFYETSLRLYLLNGDQLQAPLEKLLVSGSSGEWDTRCTGEWHDRTVTLAVAERAGREGYNDLLLSERSVQSRAEERAEDCLSVEERVTKRRYRLTYGDQRYSVPSELQVLQ
ncbi:PA3715 family protein [Pseudomonas borbori]